MIPCDRVGSSWRGVSLRRGAQLQRGGTTVGATEAGSAEVACSTASSSATRFAEVLEARNLTLILSRSNATRFGTPQAPRLEPCRHETCTEQISDEGLLFSLLEIVLS